LFRRRDLFRLIERCTFSHSKPYNLFIVFDKKCFFQKGEMGNELQYMTLLLREALIWTVTPPSGPRAQAALCRRH